MKKLLLFFVLTLSFQTINAQLFYNENCSSLTVGNVGTDVTGTTPGQGGWLTYVAATGLNTDFQVVNAGGLYGNAFQITGSATAANTRWLFKNNLIVDRPQPQNVPIIQNSIYSFKPATQNLQTNSIQQGFNLGIKYRNQFDLVNGKMNMTTK